MSANLEFPALGLAELQACTADFSAIPFDDCLRLGCVLVTAGDGARTFVLSDPGDERLLARASASLTGMFRVACAHPEDLGAFLRSREGDRHALSQLVGNAEAAADVRRPEEISLASIANDESLVVRFVNSTLYDAFRAGASDIHLENQADGLTVRYRIDGVLGMARRLEQPALSEQVVSRLKVLAELDIGERRTPQDGRISVAIDGRPVDFRVSVMPGLFGEDAVLRILDRHAPAQDGGELSLSGLGFDRTTADTIRRLATLPYGMLLVTGPTGSGKTTTLYATLSEIDHSQDKIVTIEDPVEYQLRGVLQIPVNEKKGLTFARGLRSILRHDPDRILVGEIRDRETAEIAVQAALTGHLVYTTVHANNVFDVISRFRHMGVDTYSLVTALNGVVAQRLVRRRCPHCAPREIDTVAGCAQCRGTGYRGRIALPEVLLMNDHLREAILDAVPVSRLKEMAAAQGTRLMRETALLAVRQGLTTTREIDRVTFADD
ncbi:MAG: GspE/PulE family protein [Pseudomonadota bacterium]